MGIGNHQKIGCAECQRAGARSRRGSFQSHQGHRFHLKRKSIQTSIQIRTTPYIYNMQL